MIHNDTPQWMLTVPTAAQRTSDFSQTLTSGVNGAPTPVTIWVPSSATPVAGQTNVYGRNPYPNNIIPISQINPAALKIMAIYPLPNRAATDAFGNNNFYTQANRSFHRSSNNSRMDYHHEKHSIYASGGVSIGAIDTPSPYGPDSVWYLNPTLSTGTAARYVSDDNPYLQLGDTVILSPTVVLDARGGVNRIHSNSLASTITSFTAADYASYGIPASVQATMPQFGQAPDVTSPGFFSSPSFTQYGNKRERQTNSTVSGSITKMHGKWTLKAGGEFRVYEGNYTDYQFGAADYQPSPGSYTVEYVNASGASVQNNNISQQGFAGANLLTGGGGWLVPTSPSARPALTSKYLGLFSQNDWRATSRLTLNLGRRWISSPVRRTGSIARAPWICPSPAPLRLLAAPSARRIWEKLFFLVITGFLAIYGKRHGPTLAHGLAPLTGSKATGCYVAATVWLMERIVLGGMTARLRTTWELSRRERRSFLTGPIRMATWWGFSGIRLPAPSFQRWEPIQPLRNCMERAPLSSITTASAPPRVQMWNFYIERQLSSTWFVSAGYTGSHGSHLFQSRYPLQNNQDVPAAVLAGCRQNYIATNGTNPCAANVQNPLQPTGTAPLIPFTGTIGQRTIPMVDTYYPYLALLSGLIQQDQGWSDYNALKVRVRHSFTQGFLLDANWTWSKATDTGYSELEDMQGFTDAAGGNPGQAYNNLDILNWNNDKKLSYSNVPRRLVVTGIYDLPFGKGRRFDLSNGVAQAALGGWRVGGVYTVQMGFPLGVGGLNSGSLDSRPDINRAPNEPLVLPANLQGWYDGKTTITLPDGRQYVPCNQCFLKFNPDAFIAETLTTANGGNQANLYWVGNAAINYGAMRGPGRNNMDFTLTRDFRLTEK